MKIDTGYCNVLVIPSGFNLDSVVGEVGRQPFISWGMAYVNIGRVRSQPFVTLLFLFLFGIQFSDLCYY